MKRKDIHIHVEGLQDFGQRFVRTWRELESGHAVAASDHVSFVDLETFLTKITPKRWQLLKRLHALGPVSIRALSRAVERDYKSVHGDVLALIEIGLAERDAANLVSAAASHIHADFNLAA